MSKILFIGGPGNISAATIDALLARGETIALFTHPTSLATSLDPRIVKFPGDRNDTTALAAALADFKPDIVLDFVCFEPQQAEALLPLVAGKVAQFVFVSTVDTYGYPLTRIPMRESDLWKTPLGNYAANKVVCEQIFRRPGERSLPLTIVRPAYSFGPRFVLTAMSRAGGFDLITRLRHHMPVLSPGDGSTLIHVSAAPNTGHMIARTVGAPQALHTDYTVAHPTFMTYDEYIQLFARVLGTEAEIVHIPSDVILSFDDPAVKTSLLHTLTRYNVAFSTEKFQSHFPDFVWQVSLEAWARHYIEENDRRGKFPPPEKTIYDDRLIVAWRKAMQAMRLES